MRTLKWILGPILVLLAVAVGIVIGAAAFLALAFVITHPLLLGVTAVAAGGLAASGLVHLACRWFAPARRRGLAVSMGTATGLLLLIAAGLFLYRPRTFPEVASADRTGIRIESLNTGSDLACRVIPARGGVRRGGVIFVHGGPGADAVTNGPFVEALSPLADEGFDVCLYDQIGCGLSARLADPIDYTVARQVADLEALRLQLGWEQPILIGESWGTQLIARYAAEYTDVPAAAVLVSPGPLRFADWEGRDTGSAGDRLTEEEEQVFNNLLDARFIAAALLMRINPRASVRFLPEAEAEQYGAALLAALSPGAVCDPGVLRAGSASRFNIWVAQLTMLSLKKEPLDHLDGLAAARFPVLVLRGDCDYGHEDIAGEYVDVFPRADLIPVADTGHFLLLENPQAFLAEVRKFLSETN